MLINYELLRTFVAAVDHQSFSRAASARRVTTSAVSQQIRGLEGQLGIALFERVGRQVRATEVAVRLRQVIDHSFKSIDEALESALSDAHSLKGRVAIGAPRSFAQHWLNPRVADLCKQHPELRLHLEYGVPSLLEQRLADGTLDLALMVREPEAAVIESKRVASENFLAVASPKYVLSHGAPRTLDDFLQHRYLAFDQDRAMHRPWWRSRFGPRAAAEVAFVCEAAHLEALLELTCAGLGVCVLPEYLVRPMVEAKRLLVLEPRAAKHGQAQNHVYLAWRKGALLTRRFLEVRRVLTE